jgi:hypothetical protein
MALVLHGVRLELLTRALYNEADGSTGCFAPHLAVTLLSLSSSVVCSDGAWLWQQRLGGHLAVNRARIKLTANGTNDYTAAPAAARLSGYDLDPPGNTIALV